MPEFQPSPEDMIPIRRGHLVGIKQFLGTQRIDDCVAAWSWCEMALNAYDEAQKQDPRPVPEED